MKWINRTIIHTVPLGDPRQHDYSPDCWCKPEVEEHAGGENVIHNSLDGRELFEPDERKSA